MNCVQTEARIYLYRELAPQERKNLDRHLATCRSCAELHERVNEDRVAMRRIFQIPAPVPDYSAITRKVMNTVGKMQRKNSSLDIAFRHPIINPVRYAFAVLSTFLVVTFFVEQGPVIESQGDQKVATLAAQENILLNSESFHRSLSKPRDATKISLYDCVVRCLHTAQGNCADCNSKILKYN
jgi:hypothetical protein